MTMTNEREASCTERIATHLAGRAEDVRKMLAVQDGETKVCRYCGRTIELVDDVDWQDAETEHEVCSVNGTHEPDPEYSEDSLYEFGLGVSRKVLIRFDMSTGGPADWLEILCVHEDANGTEYLTVERVTYHFADWFDHAEQNVEEGTPLFELAGWVAETQGGQ